jgi:hypothetical protein
MCLGIQKRKKMEKSHLPSNTVLLNGCGKNEREEDLGFTS